MADILTPKQKALVIKHRAASAQARLDGLNLTPEQVDALIDTVVAKLRPAEPHPVATVSTAADDTLAVLEWTQASWASEPG